jgi:hypothetical protein
VSYDPIYPHLDDSVVRIYDYIDADGDMLALDTVDDHWLAITVVEHGKTAVLSSMLTDPDDARRMAAHLIRWADMSDRTR